MKLKTNVKRKSLKTKRDEKVIHHLLRPHRIKSTKTTEVIAVVLVNLLRKISDRDPEIGKLSDQDPGIGKIVNADTKIPAEGRKDATDLLLKELVITHFDV